MSNEQLSIVCKVYDLFGTKTAKTVEKQKWPYQARLFLHLVIIMIKFDNALNFWGKVFT